MIREELEALAEPDGFRPFRTGGQIQGVDLSVGPPKHGLVQGRLQYSR